MRTKWLILFCIFFIPGSIIACICRGIPSFCETIGTMVDQDGFLPNDVLLLRGEVVDQSFFGIQVAFQELLHGNLAAGDTIFIHNGDGTSCGVGTNGFGVGKEYLFLVRQSPPPLLHYDLISQCLNTSVDFDEDGKLIMHQADETVLVEYESFVESAECGRWRTFLAPIIKYPFPREEVLEDNILVSPNPVMDFIYIDYRLTVARRFALEIYDLSGRRIGSFQTGTLDHIGQTRFDLSQLPPGLFLLRLIDRDKSSLYKIMKT